ncbi:glycoside hydrolase domain-containing protein [Paenibacillus sp. FSL E2-0190]|uniref:glycoside hydrolase domain-containing protein n=1 Tax=Paenibacillus sp. FSL E2-0190 TaxID=2954504 RepID=UPI0030EEFEBB
MALGCDTATNVTAARLTTLKNNKFTFVCRYLNRVEGYQDGLTSAEITRISDGGLYIISLYQISKSLDHFTKANGIKDAETAVGLASDLGQTSSTPIYFAIDRDMTSTEITNNIVPYFQGIKSVLDSSTKNSKGYKMGIYGSRAVCSHIRGTNSATTRYTFIVDNDWQGNFEDWNLRQYNFNIEVGTSTGKINVDYVESSSHSGGGWKK